MPPIILLIRHSNTTFDDKVDALLDPPLDEEGVERLERTIKFLRESSYKIGRIISSPLQRTLSVAQMLSDGNLKVTPNNQALPWNLGDLMGKKNTLVKDKLQFLHDYPDIKAPHGESYRNFYTRWSAFLDKLMQYAEAKPAEVLVTVTHSRNINALQSIIGGAPVGDVQEDATPEASVTLLAQNGVSGEWSYKLIWDGK